MRNTPAILLCLALHCPGNDVRQFGARGDGVAKDTAAIQRAIDAADQAGGGSVVLGPGRYVSGTLFLRSHVRLILEAGAVLLMSPDDADFAAYEPPPKLLSRRVTRYAFSTRGLPRAARLPPTEDDSETTYMRHALLLAEDIRHAAIEGAGRIDGNRTRRGGPKPIAVKNSQHITIRGVTIAHAPNYAISLLGAEEVDIEGVRILNAFADGIDPDNSRFVRITNCYIDSADDAICPKASLALGRRAATEHLTVSNCILRTTASAFKFGTESAGDFRYVTVTNLNILPREGATRGPVSGLALESVDGAAIEAVTISNVTMRGVRTPIFLRLGVRGRGMDDPKPGSLRGVGISNVVATGATLASSITAAPGSAVQGVTLRDLRISTQPDPQAPTPGFDVPERIEQYPEATMFGDLPAAGLYVRRAEGLRLLGVTLAVPQAVRRPMIVLDQTQGITIEGLETTGAGEPVYRVPAK